MHISMFIETRAYEILCVSSKTIKIRLHKFSNQGDNQVRS